jgi:colicin import membrane protein
MNADALLHWKLPPGAPGELGPRAHVPGKSSWLLSAMVHGGLLLALALGMQWKRSADEAVVEAELWAAMPATAAKAPRPALEPAPQPAPDPAPPLPRTPDIVTERMAPKDAKVAPTPKREPEPRVAIKPLEKPATQAPTPKPPTQTAVDDSKKLAADRTKEIDRLMALSKVDPSARTGSAQATEALTGSTLGASGAPSAGYAGRIVARIKPNIVFPERDTTPGNPASVVEIRTAPDGTILSRRVKQPSGLKAWDDAVLRAIDKAEVLPRDTDGRAPPLLEITFRVRD